MLLVVEPSAPVSAALRGFLQGEVDLRLAQNVDEALQAIRAKAPDVVLASVSANVDGEGLTAQIHRQAPGTLVILVYVPDEPNPHQRASRAMADAFVVGPLKKATVLGALHSVLTIRALRLELKHVQRELDRLKMAKQAEARQAKAPLNAPDPGFFKKYMVLEVKRSKRYRYPVSLLVVGLDVAMSGDLAPSVDSTALRAEVVSSLSQATREVDMVIPFAGERYLVLLPHTAREGAAEVAERIRGTLANLKALVTTASVGIASFDPRSASTAAASFGILAQQAEKAQGEASQAGGDRIKFADGIVTQKRSRISMG